MQDSCSEKKLKNTENPEGNLRYFVKGKSGLLVDGELNQNRAARERTHTPFERNNQGKDPCTFGRRPQGSGLIVK